MAPSPFTELHERYLAAVSLWGQRLNLVGSLERAALELHVRDSLTACEWIPAGARVVDLGSGAGLPGVPLACSRPDVQFTLVEIRERRVHFLRHVVRELGLGCEVRRQKIEAAPETPFDLALARAVGPPRDVVAMAREWIGPAGEVWIWTRASASECGVPEAIVAPIEADGSRGHVLRVHADAIPRGTSGAKGRFDARG